MWPIGFPLVSTTTAAGSTDLAAWSFLRQYWYATLERYALAGQDFWPRGSFAWFSGIVPTGGITESTLTDGSQTWKGGTDDITGNSYFDPWVGSLTDSDSLPYAPTVWWIYFDHPRQHELSFRVLIRSWTATQITFDNIRDLVTAKVIPSIASLEGYRYLIFGYPWALGSAERIIQWPNDNVWSTGTVTTLAIKGTLPASPTHALLRDDTVAWRTNEHVGRDLLVYGDDILPNSGSRPTLHRVSITANETNVLHFSTQSWTPAVGTTWAIVNPGKRAIPGRAVSEFWGFYAGARDPFASHSPDDAITLGELRSALMPAAFVQVPTHELDGTCDLTNIPAFDQDYWTDAYQVSGDENYTICGRPADKPYAPMIPQTFRFVQVSIQVISTFYVEDKSYDGAAVIPFINPAKMFQFAGINYYTGTTGSAIGSGSYYTSNQIAVSGFTLPYYPLRVFYSIALADGNYMSGEGVMINSTTLEDSPETPGAADPFVHNTDPTSGPQPVAEGRGIVISPGWSAYIERQFKRMFPVTYFEPDLSSPVDGSAPAPQDPPAPFWWDDPDQGPNSSDGVGHFRKIATSTHYVDRRSQSTDYNTPLGFADEGGGDENLIQDGDIARFVAMNFCDPSVSNNGNGGRMAASSPLTIYYDHFFNGKPSPQNEYDRNSEIFGTASGGGTKTSIVDRSKNFHNLHFSGAGGSMRFDKGTATSGSTTSFNDSAKDDSSWATSPTVLAHTYWEPGRFAGFTNGPYSEFVVEVLFGTTDWDNWSTSNGTIEARLMATGSTAPVGATWTEPLVKGSASGRPYQIAEPYVLNKYNGVPIRIVDGSYVYNGTVVGNGSNSIFVTPAATQAFTTNAAYVMFPPQPGTIWKRVSGAWQELKSGTDSVRIGVHPSAQNFHATSLENLPHIVKRFGPLVQGDILCGEIVKEAHDALNVLTAVRRTVDWTSEAVDGVVENNENTGSGSAAIGTAGDEGAMEASAESNADASYASLAFAGPDGGLPSATIVTEIGDSSPGCHTVTLFRRYAYAVASGITPRFTVTGTFYDFATTPGGDPLTSCPDALAFNDCGDPVLNQAWKSFGSGSGTTFRVKLGASGPPTPAVWCPPPAPTRNRSGYDVTDGCVILHGDFVYVG